MSKHLVAQWWFDNRTNVSSYNENEPSGKNFASSLPQMLIRSARDPIDQYIINLDDDKDDGVRVAYMTSLESAK